MVGGQAATFRIRVTQAARFSALLTKKVCGQHPFDVDRYIRKRRQDGLAMFQFDLGLNNPVYLGL